MEGAAFASLVALKGTYRGSEAGISLAEPRFTSGKQVPARGELPEAVFLYVGQGARKAKVRRTEMRRQGSALGPKVAGPQRLIAQLLYRKNNA